MKLILADMLTEETDSNNEISYKELGFKINNTQYRLIDAYGEAYYWAEVWFNGINLDTL